MKRLLLIVTVLVIMVIPHNQAFAFLNPSSTEEDFRNLGKSSIFYDEMDFFLAGAYDIYYTKVGMSKNDFIDKIQMYGMWKNINDKDFSPKDIVKDGNGNLEKVYLIRKIKDRIVFYTGVFKDDKLDVSVVQFYSNDINDLVPIYEKTVYMYAYYTKATEKTMKNYKVGNSDASMLYNTETQNILLSVAYGSFPTEKEYNGKKYKYGFIISHADKKYKL